MVGSRDGGWVDNGGWVDGCALLDDLSGDSNEIFFCDGGLVIFVEMNMISIGISVILSHHIQNPTYSLYATHAYQACDGTSVS